MNFPGDVQVADRLMARKGKTFYRAARLLPRSLRNDVAHLYGFCRRVDDLADEPEVDVEERRRALGALAKAFEQRDPSGLQAGNWSFAVQGPMADAAHTLIGAAIQDLDQKQPETQEDLLAYSFGVAGTVGLMMARLLRAAPAGFQAAVALGMAMQLSNIARDVAEDLENGRVYLPALWVTAEDVRSAIHVSNPLASQKVQTAISCTVALAETLYETAFDGIRFLPWSIRWSILAAALCYRAIGREVARRGTHSWTQRVVISSWRKVWLIVLAGVRLLGPRFWLPRQQCKSPALGAAVYASLRQLGVS